jgi:hypothetical protein
MWHIDAGSSYNSDIVVLHLAPEYWDGQVLGEGPAPTPNYTDQVPSRVVSAANLALAAHNINKAEERVPLRALAEGETFDPNEHQPGTIVAMNQERVQNTAANVFVAVESFSSGDTLILPERNNTISTTKDEVGMLSCFATLGPLAYGQWTDWGVVVSAQKGEPNRLFTPRSVEGNPEEKVTVERHALLYGRLPVGRTVHYRQEGTAALQRTNRIEICEEG